MQASLFKQSLLFRQALSSLEHRTSHPIVLSAHVPPFMHGFGLHPSFVLQPLPPYPNAQLTVLVVVMVMLVVAKLDGVMLDVDDVLTVVVRLVVDVLVVVVVPVLLDVVVDVLLDVDVLVVVVVDVDVDVLLVVVVVTLCVDVDVDDNVDVDVDDNVDVDVDVDVDDDIDVDVDVDDDIDVDVEVEVTAALVDDVPVEATVEDVDGEPSQASPEKPTEQLQLKPNGWSCSNLHLFVMQSDAFVNKSSPFVVVVPWQSDRHSASHESYPTASETARQS